MIAAMQPQILDLAVAAWQIHAGIATEQDGAVRPSMPILFFGDLARYEASRLRVITVGLNPSDEEFPHDDPWSRFPGGAQLTADELDQTFLTRYVDELSRYFEVTPYRRWFDRSFEPLLRGIDASYYPHAANVALHTDIASPVPTNPTWSELSPARRALHHGGAALWRRLADLLAPDLIVVSVAREHLAAISTSPFSEWGELTRVDRERPFVVSTTRMPVADGRKSAVVVFGRCTNVPFGSVSFSKREWIGAQIASYLKTMTPRAAAP
jgi:hypothetical protein